MQPARVTRYQPQEHFPHGPRNLEQDDMSELTREGKSRETTTASDDSTSTVASATSEAKNANLTTSRSSDKPTASVRRKRSLVVSDRKVRSADVGVSGIYEVISEADLAFSPDAHAEAVTVFQVRYSTV